MKTDTKTDTKSNALATTIKPELVTAPVEQIRSYQAIMAGIAFNDDNQAAFNAGNKITLRELAFATLETVKTAESASIRAANMIRLARQMPAMKLTVKDGNGKEVESEVPAYDWLCSELKEKAPTTATFANMLGMVTILDVRDANDIKASPFALKESIGTLRKLGALNEETLKLTNGEGGRAKAVVKLLKSGDATVNGLRPLLQTLGMKKKAKAETATEKATREAKEAADAKKAEKEAHTPDRIVRDAKLLLATYEKVVSFVGVIPARTAEVQYSIYLLAKLAGLAVVDVNEPAPKPLKDIAAGK